MSEVMHPSDLSVGQSISVIKEDMHHCIFKRALAQHPDGEFAEYVLQGIAEGFCISNSQASWPHESVRRNMQSAMENLGWLKVTLRKRCMAAGKVVGPLEMGSVQGGKISHDFRGASSREQAGGTFNVPSVFGNGD